MPPTNPDCTKSKSHGDICSKNHHNINDKVAVQQLLLANSKSLIENYDIGREDNEKFWIKSMPLTKPNCTKSKNHDDNYNINCNSDKIDGEKEESDNLEVSE